MHTWPEQAFNGACFKSDILLYTWRFTEQITSSLYSIFQSFSYLGESSIISPEARAFDIISPFLKH